MKQLFRICRVLPLKRPPMTSPLLLPRTCSADGPMNSPTGQ
ncbi:MAG: hypothetical protein WCI22_12590 [Actinomycetota bacterium]